MDMYGGNVALDPHLKNGGLRATFFKRLGYLAEQLSLPIAGFPERWLVSLSAGYARLDPGRPAGGLFNRQWRLRSTRLRRN